MVFQAFPTGVNEECYWALIYLLYDYMTDENLALVLSNVVDKPIEVIANDIYKINNLILNENTIQEVKFKLNIHGFEEWKKHEWLKMYSIIVMSRQGIEAADDGAGWRYEYDQVGRLVRITDPEGTVQKRYIYDLHGWNNKCKGKNIFIWIE